MIVGYVLVSVLAGLLASVVALLLGASFWLAFGLYVLVGSAVLILLPAALMVASLLVGRAKAPTATGLWNETGNPHSAEPSASQHHAIVETSMRILAVDDDPFILELIPMISAKAGFSEVVSAASGEQALKLLASSDIVFDCLLLDISMPGMDGVELCQRVRQIPLYRQTPIIMLTAMRDMINMGDAYRAGATDYATKPFSIDELGTRLRLAQEAIYAQRETDSVRHEATGYYWNPAGSYGFKLPDGLRLSGVGSLVDSTVLSNYLTQLPKKEMTDIQVFAVSIDEIETVHTRSTPQQFVMLLQDVAAVAADCFGADRAIMAYTRNATLLIVVNSADTLPVLDIEIDIEKRLQGNFAKYGTGDGTWISLSVGGPVQPQSAKAGRARMATDRVISHAKQRAIDKQGRTVERLFKH